MRTLIKLTISDGVHSKAWFLSGNEHSRLDKAVAALQETLPTWETIDIQIVKLERKMQ
jgi:hypothetical protein